MTPYPARVQARFNSCDSHIKLVAPLLAGLIELFRHLISSSTCDAALTLAERRFALTRPRLLLLPIISSTSHIVLSNSSGTKQAIEKRPQHTINTMNSFTDVRNNYSVVDDRSQLLAWLSPLDPRLRHRAIQERRVNDIGEWLIQTEEFRTWCDLGGEGGGEKTVLFCYGYPGAGKTFIR